MKEFWQQVISKLTQVLLQLLEEHPGKMLGVLSGFFLGLIVVLLGFWRTVVILLFVAAGFFLGKRRDDHRSFSELLQTFFGDRK